jgi:hypothetical protein
VNPAILESRGLFTVRAHPLHSVGKYNFPVRANGQAPFNESRDAASSNTEMSRQSCFRNIAGFDFVHLFTP